MWLRHIYRPNDYLSLFEFSYLKVADIVQYTENYVQVLYKFDKTKTAGFLSAIGLADGLNSHAEANALDNTSWYYQSDVLNAALKSALQTNATTVKNALESYIKSSGGTAMPLTDQNGRSIATNLPTGLYLLTETKVPEAVTGGNPFLVSLPMTNVNGGGLGTQITDGGHEWLYDVTVYPKNETAIVTLTKEIREAKKDTGKNDGANAITDGYGHYATGSAGDTLEYQIISTLPTITSSATYITEYTFQDVLSKGLSYDSNTPIKIEWYTDTACTNLVTTWTQGGGKFTFSRSENEDLSHTLTIKMTDAGLAEINTANTAANNTNGALYAGYSNYTMRITYAAIVNSDASVVYGENGNDNKVVLTWRRTSSSYYDTLIDDCHFYTFGIDLEKTFSDGKDSQDLFDHVLFKLQNKDDGYYVTAKLNETDGIWYVTGHTDKEASATAMYPVTWNGKKGHLVVKGLEDDEYILTEIETADSYVKLERSISIDITASEDDSRPCDIYDADTLGVVQNDSRYNFDGGYDLHLANMPQAALAHNHLTATATRDTVPVEMLTDEADGSENALVYLKVRNDHAFNLPESGENSQQWMPIIGGGILGLAFILVLFLPKRKEEKNAQQ